MPIYMGDLLTQIAYMSYFAHKESYAWYEVQLCRPYTCMYLYIYTVYEF